MMDVFYLMLFITNVVYTTASKVRVVTWNVNDNKKMNGFWDSAIDKVLGLKSSNMADVYAIGLQENCWNCDMNEFSKLSKKFLDRINQFKVFQYEVIGVEGSRESNVCERFCKLFNTHGSTILIVIAKKHLVHSKKGFHWNDGCSHQFFENDEKGVAAMKLKLSDGKSLCFGTLHLDSKSPETRQKCLKLFFEDAIGKSNWPTNCEYQFLFGDYNTRTGPNNEDASQSGAYFDQQSSTIQSLKPFDEFKGSKPFGTTTSWNKGLLAYINSLQGKKFKEGSLNFAPTYSIRPKGECANNLLCYRGNRAISWTDRIIYTSGKLEKYDAIVSEYGDHFPVYGQFII